MRCVVITVAGISSRFNEGFPDKRLKAIYCEGDYRQTILYQLLQKCRAADRIVIVGGYLYEELSRYIAESLEEPLREKIDLVYNEFYEKYASGYSLYKGLEQALKQEGVEELLFVEGDLEIDADSFRRIWESEKDVFTYTSETIYSDKAVVVYEDTGHRYHYIYSTEHGSLRIADEFYSIYNSGQCWKFHHMGDLKTAMDEFLLQNRADTNLLIIQRYFDRRSREEIEPIAIKRWMNCNTRRDYMAAKKYWEVDGE